MVSIGIMEKNMEITTMGLSRAIGVAPGEPWTPPRRNRLP